MSTETYSHVYDLAGGVEGWERRIRERIQGAMSDGSVVEVNVDEATGLAEATLLNATSSDINAIDEELVYERVTSNPQNRAETWVSLGSVVKD
jgi:hypothetical protein